MTAAVRYRTIVADPPWRYDDPWPIGRIPKGATHDGRRTPIKYPTLSIGQIEELPVQHGLADPSGCHVYLWTTNRYLPHAFGVLRMWGARYSQTLIWCKTPMGKGPGGAFAQNAEFVLFGMIGSLPWLEKQDSVWHNWPRTTVHSRKPEAFLDMVECVSPAPRLEMFARRQRLGWDTWGDQALCHVEMETA